MNNQKNTIIILVVLFIIIVAGIIYASFTKKSDDPKDLAQNTTTKPENINEFSDGSLGINFYITKDFERIDDATLKQFNPNFIYGFAPKDVEDVQCILSQTKRTSSGEVTQEYLMQGTWEVIEQNNTDAKLIQSKNINIGEVKGVSISFSYNENTKDMRQLQYVGTNDQLTTFAFCNSPSSLYNFYQPIFEQFLNSIKITK